MPIYEYQATDPARGCERCRRPFEVMQKLSDAPLKTCPSCGAPVEKLSSAPSIGWSRSSLDDRAKSAGFTKLKRLGKGEYEKVY